MCNKKCHYSCAGHCAFENVLVDILEVRIVRHIKICLKCITRNIPIVHRALIIIDIIKNKIIEQYYSRD